MGLGRTMTAAASPSNAERPHRPNSLCVTNNNQSVNAGGEVSCQCCPYGFHIDLDFVRFCESLATGAHLKARREERRTRRLQCNSMEVLLGLTTPTFTLNSSTLEPIIDREADIPAVNKLSVNNINVDLNRAVDDFEAALSLSSRHSQVSTALSTSTASSTGRDLETDNSFENHKSNEALQSIRGQMAASLAKLRELEQQVKMIPVLQVKVSVLQEEKRQMALQLQELKNKNARAQIVLPSPAKRDFGVSTLTGHVWDATQIIPSSQPKKRDFGVSTVASTLRDGAVQTEQWIKQGVKSVSSKLIQTLRQPLLDSGTQTPPPVAPKKAEQFCQTIQVDLPKAVEMVPIASKGNGLNACTQTQPAEVVPTTPCTVTTAVAVQTYQPMVFHRQMQTEPPSASIVAPIAPSTTSVPSPDKTKEEQLRRKSIAVGDGAINDVLCERCVSRRTRHVSCGTDLIRPLSGVSVATQSYDTPCQECEARSKICAAETVDREVQTSPKPEIPASPKPSRIPRLKADHCTITPQPSVTASCLHQDNHSESERSDEESDRDEECEIQSQKESSEEEEEEEDDEEGDDEEEQEEEEPSHPPVEIVQPRIRVEPSVEMKAALKVLNDSIHRPQRGSSRMLVNAIDIVRREWIRVSSTKEADAHVVEDYMDYMESLSMALLERVANLSDNNGNTALHYAVSHSQWDVVSLLLDSKVCYPQLRNKAGYSPPMLAALAQPTNTTELQVLQRLFSLADVNSKATQHGQTALMLSVSHGRVEVCRLLLAAGASVNVQDADGSTALMCAAEHGHTSIVKLLLAQPDIDLHLRDNDGSTALSIAMEAGHKDIGLLIYAHMNFHRSNSSSAASSPVHASASPLPTIRRKAGSPLPIVQLN